MAAFCLLAEMEDSGRAIARLINDNHLQKERPHSPNKAPYTYGLASDGVCVCVCVLGGGG